MECLLPYLCMVTVPHIMVRLERMLDYRGVGLVRFHCIRTSAHANLILIFSGVYLDIWIWNVISHVLARGIQGKSHKLSPLPGLNQGPIIWYRCHHVQNIV